MRKTGRGLPIVNTGFREPLPGNSGVKVCLGGAIDFAHAFFPDLFHYLVIPNDPADHRCLRRPNSSEIEGLAICRG